VAAHDYPHVRHVGKPSGSVMGAPPDP